MSEDRSETDPDYFRRDQRDGVSPPDLAKECTFAEHIVHARGKRTRYTSVSLDLARIKDFGESSYRLERMKLSGDKHVLVRHDSLLDELRTVIRGSQKADRLRAIQALNYATRRKEGLVDWHFDIKGIDRKNLLTWAATKIQPYFNRIS